MKIELSKEADQDILELFDYGLENFGLKSAIKYQEELISFLKLLEDNSELGMTPFSNSEKIRRVTFRLYHIYYSVTRSTIVIGRVIHSSKADFKFDNENND